ncbi:MAG TPA: type II and III secretion system protein family protein [Hyphomicrobiaceae bacterium]|jgi:pilus assembly protein CpaC|nr:type II and III secretion system protein family protein [Hyphomicrobiaceae bacterium]
MRIYPRGLARALLLAVIGVAVAPLVAVFGHSMAWAGDPVQNSVLQISARGPFPMTTKVSLGTSKSLLVQFPFELRDVLVSDPEKMDAVVQSSNRVFLIAKKVGQTNAFFFDTHGKQVLTLEVSVGADLSALDDLIRRFVPGSSVKSEMAGNAIVLTGVVRTPVDAARSGDLAFQFAQANRNAISSSFSSASKGGGDGETTTQTQVGQGQQASGGKKSDLVINLLAIEGEEQVMLKVTVAEVQRTILKQFGINLGAAIQSGNFSTAILTENALPLTAAAGLGKLPIPGIGTEALEAGSAVSCATTGVLCNYNAGPGGKTFGNSGLSNSYSWRNGTVSSALRAMERDGLVRTLAEPNLTAVSGETAKFLAGGEFPIPLVDSTGKMSVTFKEFGVGLAFTPVVMSEGRISLKIETEVSELTDVGSVTLSDIRIPALKKRQAKSTVELPSGGSLALAGMISEDTRQNIDGFPGLKDVPVIGALFRSRDFSKNETELVVIVTPYVVRPTSRKNLARPDDGLAAATDRKANFLGHINRVYGRGRELPPGALRGEYGFIVE